MPIDQFYGMLPTRAHKMATLVLEMMGFLEEKFPGVMEWDTRTPVNRSKAQIVFTINPAPNSVTAPYIAQELEDIVDKYDALADIETVGEELRIALYVEPEFEHVVSSRAAIAGVDPTTALISSLQAVKALTEGKTCLETEEKSPEDVFDELWRERKRRSP